ncbi:MAG: SDR family NAD(P)-dependent oxidoreductase [Beijerinckiaceae bacterium]|nr:SDR family NAD(P)-dependent oxidoreductase [Beijerinckiaceae bacterium]
MAIAVVAGASGGVGAALVRALRGQGAFEDVVTLSRTGAPAFDITDEASIAAAAQALAGRDVRLVIDATGFLHDARYQPEKSLRQLDPAHMLHSFAVNAMGPALMMKHFLPLCPREGRFVFATLSARVGSIADNRLGGWHSYRASKAALNQFLRTGAVELARTRPHAICVALHPGTVDTRMSQVFAKQGLDVRPPDVAATDLLRVIESLTPQQTGGFFDYKGEIVPF